MFSKMLSSRNRIIYVREFLKNLLTKKNGFKNKEIHFLNIAKLNSSRVLKFFSRGANSAFTLGWIGKISIFIEEQHNNMINIKF